jgi:hypothetical protein
VRIKVGAARGSVLRVGTLVDSDHSIHPRNVMAPHGSELAIVFCCLRQGRNAIRRVALRCFRPFGLFYWGVASAAFAHEGHDLVKPEQSASTPHGLPRLVTNSEIYALVAILDGLHLTIYLDRFQDNAPVTDANVTVTINEEPVLAKSTHDGTYVVASQQFSSGGLFQLVFDIKAPESDDLLIGKLSLASGV